MNPTMAAKAVAHTALGWRKNDERGKASDMT